MIYPIEPNAKVLMFSISRLAKLQKILCIDDVNRFVLFWIQPHDYVFLLASERSLLLHPYSGHFCRSNPQPYKLSSSKDIPHKITDIRHSLHSSYILHRARGSGSNFSRGSLSNELVHIFTNGLLFRRSQWPLP